LKREGVADGRGGEKAAKPQKLRAAAADVPHRAARL